MANSKALTRIIMLRADAAQFVQANIAAVFEPPQTLNLSCEQIYFESEFKFVHTVLSHVHIRVWPYVRCRIKQIRSMIKRASHTLALAAT